MAKFLWLGLLAGVAAGGCAVAPTAPTASPAPPVAASAASHYRCEQDIDFTVRFMDDSATLDAGPRGSEVLLRDAGGVTPQQTVYSNPHLRAEFGLGANGRGAILHYLSPQLMAQCVLAD